MKIKFQKPAKFNQSLVLRTTPGNFLRTVEQTSFKKGHPKFDLTKFNATVLSIKRNQPVLPVIMYVTPHGIPTNFKSVQGLYSAVAAEALDIPEINVYVFVIDHSNLVQTPSLDHLPKGFALAKPDTESTVNKLASYEWWVLKPADKQFLAIKDIKGHEYDIDKGTIYGSKQVKLGVRILDGDDLKTSFIIDTRTFNRLVKNSVRRKKAPTVFEAQEIAAPKVKETPIDILETVPVPEPEFEEEAIEVAKNKIVNVDELTNYNDVDDLSLELYGHHLSDYDSGDYLDLDSISAVQDINKPKEDTPSTLGRAYSSFFEKFPLAARAKEDPSVAENSLITVVKHLFSHLVDLGFEPSVLCANTFRESLDGCSPSIQKYLANAKQASIKHLVVKVNNLILDPCFKRLGKAVRLDHYPIANFETLWKDYSIVASPTTISKAHHAGLFTKPAKELQVPTPVVTPSKAFAKSIPGKITLKGRQTDESK